MSVTVIDSAERAQRRRFVGSPAFLIDGIDPFAVLGAAAGLACRVYRAPVGPAGVPSVEQLRVALLEHAAGAASGVGTRLPVEDRVP